MTNGSVIWNLVKIRVHKALFGPPRLPAPLPARRAYRPEGRAYSSERGVITFTSSVQVSAQPPAKKTAGLIEQETLKKRISNVE